MPPGVAAQMMAGWKGKAPEGWQPYVLAGHHSPYYIWLAEGLSTILAAKCMVLTCGMGNVGHP